MREIVKQSICRLEAGERVIWCVILSAQGSTPQGPGARMAVFSDGSSLGTVGGGAVELQSLAFACSMPEDALAQVREYDLISGGTETTGMIYLMNRIRKMPPQDSYYEGIADAYRRLGLEGQIDTVLKPALERSRARGNS